MPLINTLINFLIGGIMLLALIIAIIKIKRDMKALDLDSKKNKLANQSIQLPYISQKGP
jgi:hypothetical protein